MLFMLLWSCSRKLKDVLPDFPAQWFSMFNFCLNNDLMSKHSLMWLPGPLTRTSHYSSPTQESMVCHPLRKVCYANSGEQCYNRNKFAPVPSVNKKSYHSWAILSVSVYTVCALLSSLLYPKGGNLETLFPTFSCEQGFDLISPMRSTCMILWSWERRGSSPLASCCPEAS